MDFKYHSKNTDAKVVESNEYYKSNSETRETEETLYALKQLVEPDYYSCDDWDFYGDF